MSLVGCTSSSCHREKVLKPSLSPHCQAGEDDHAKKNPSYPWPHCQTWSYRTYQPSQTQLFLNTLMLPFDTQVCQEHQICLRFHRILKVILEMAFSAHFTQIWKLNWISMTIISKVAWKYIWCCHQIQRGTTVPYSGRKLCSESLKAWSRWPRWHVFPMQRICRARHIPLPHSLRQVKLAIVLVDFGKVFF